MKQTRKHFTLLYWCVIIAISAFIASIAAYVNAYFSSTVEEEGELTFHNINLEINAPGAGNTFSTNISKVMPGDTLQLNDVSVKNIGSAEVYSIINFNIYISRPGYTDYNVDYWQNLDGTAINTTNLNSNTTGATKISAGGSKTFNLSHEFSATKFDNSFKNASIEIIVNAYGIQTAHLEPIGSISTDNLIATKMLVDENYSYKAQNIVDYSQFNNVDSLFSTTPSNELVYEGFYLEYYNFNTINADTNDLFYLYVSNADYIAIIPGNYDFEVLIPGFIASGTLPDDAIRGENKLNHIFTISGAFVGNFDVAVMSETNKTPEIEIRTTPKGMTEEDGKKIYAIDYEDIKYGDVELSTPLYSGDIEPADNATWIVDVYNIKISNITDNDVISINIDSGVSIALFGFNNYTFEEIIQLNWEGSEGYKNGVGIVDGVSIPISVTYELTPGEDFRLWFFVAPIADQYTINIDIMPCYEVDYEDIDGKTVTFDEATEIMDLSSIDANGTRFDIYNFKINNAELEALSVTIDQGVFALYVPNAYYSAEEVLIAYLSDNIPANAIRMGDMETLQTLSGSFDMAEGDFRFCLVVVTATIFPPYTVSIKCEKVPAYEIDYADIKSGVVEYTVPTEYMPTEEGGEVDLYNFRIKGITEDAKVYLYVQNISWGGYVVKDYNLDLETTMGILLGGSNIPGDAEIDSLATGGQFLNACDLTAGQTFKAMILHVTVPGAPLKVQVYCVPNGERPYLESDFAYKLTGDKTGYSIFLPNLASEKASVVIPDEYRGLPVTEIATYGFRRASSITSVTMGKNIKKIGDYAFDNLTKITSITLPEGLTHIGKGAFNDTLALESIHIPDSVVSIGDRAFAYSYIKTITFSENSQLTSLGKEVFWYVWHIESITIPSGIMSFDSTLYKQEISSLKTLILMPKEGYKWQWSTDGTNWYDFTDNKPSGPYYRQVTI